MNNNPNTQLPQEVVEEIKLSAMAFAAGMWPGENRHDQKQREYVKDVFIAGATAYATKMQEVQQENEELRRWKMEAAELLTKIHSYAHKHLEIKLGESIVDFVIARAKERDELKRQNDKLKEHAAGWRPLLEGVLNDWNSSALKPELKNKIRKFLYGEE